MKTVKNNRLKKLGLIILVFFGLYFIIFLINPQSYRTIYLNLSVTKISFDIISTLLLSISIVELCFFIERKMNKVMPWTTNSIKRLLLQTVVQIISVFLLLIVFTIFSFFIMNALKIDYQTDRLNLNDLLYFVFAIIFLTLIVGAANTTDYLVFNWKNQIKKTAEYQIKAAENKQLIAEAESQALRLQLDPHFIFNNLSILSELILKDQQLGFEYTENFAKVYRYLLINSKKKLITLKDELKFLDAYLFLLKNRMGTGVIFKINVPDSQTNLNLPPLTLQLLVENAIKHNRIEKENPLQIEIFTNDFKELIISNNLLPLVKSPYSSAIGLENIRKRFALLSDKKPMFEKTESMFIVKIPLLS